MRPVRWRRWCPRLNKSRHMIGLFGPRQERPAHRVPASFFAFSLSGAQGVGQVGQVGHSGQSAESQSVTVVLVTGSVPVAVTVSSHD